MMPGGTGSASPAGVGEAARLRAVVTVVAAGVGFAHAVAKQLVLVLIPPAAGQCVACCRQEAVNSEWPGLVQQWRCWEAMSSVLCAAAGMPSCPAGS